MSRRRLARLITPALALVLVAGACSTDQSDVVVSGVDPATAPKNLVETLEAEGFTILAGLVEEAGLNEVLSDDESSFTLFAPSDAAFGELAPGLAELFSGDDEVVADPPSSAEPDESPSPEQSGVSGEADVAPDAEETGTVEGGEGAGDGQAGSTTGGGGAGDDADDDEVGGQLPPQGEDSEDEGTGDVADDTTGSGATGSGDDATDDTATGDDATDDAATDDTATDDTAAESGEGTQLPAPSPVGPRPSREEIRTLLADLLSYHVVEDTYLAADLEGAGSLTSLEGSELEIGSRQEESDAEDAEPTTVATIQGVDIADTDLRATNGVIHTIDSLLIPEDREVALADLVASIPVTSDVVSTLQSTGEHGQLLAAVQQAGLVSDLTGAGQLTLFAPTDAAFEALTPDQQAALSNPDILASVLGYHVITRTITTADVSNQEEAGTLEGQGVLILNAGGGTHTVADVEIERSIVTTNGVVHVIGEVLVPDSATGPGGL